MLRAFATSSALRRSREAIAVTSIQSLFCIAGITFLTAIPAVLRIPQRTFLPIPGILEPRATENAGHGAAEEGKICAERPMGEVDQTAAAQHQIRPGRYSRRDDRFRLDHSPSLVAGEMGNLRKRV